MSIEDKREKIQEARKYHDENSEKIRFDANVPKTIVFPANWNETVSFVNRQFDDQKNPGEKKTVTYTIYKVHNPNAQDTKTLRTLEASSALNEEINKFLDMANDQGWEGASMATITKVQKGNSSYSSWTVKGDKCTEETLRELRITE